MADDNSGKKHEIGRRDTLKLASALSALGIGLGVMLEADDAAAATARIPTANLGKLTVKLYKFNAESKSNTLVHTFDLNTLLGRLQRGGTFSIKLFNQKGESAEIVAENEIEVVSE